MAMMETLPNEKKCKCQICCRSFDYSSDLKKHVRTHTGEKPYSCKLCKKSFGQSSSIKRHLRIHTGEKPYSCNICEKAFAELGHLKEHMRTHTGEKPYICIICEKTCAQRGQLKEHMRIHTSEKPYRCQLCQKSFQRTSCLRRHMRTHSIEKPYICEVCNKTFNKLGNLKKHRRAHTTEKHYEHKRSRPNSRNSSPQCKLKALDLKTGRDVIATVSDHFTAVELSENMYPQCSEIVSPFLSIKDGECHNTNKFKAVLGKNVSWSKSFGCCLCDTLLERKKEFVEHCSGHRFSAPDDIVFWPLMNFK